MIKVAKLFEEEKIKAVNQAVKQAVKNINKERIEDRKVMVRKMLKNGETYSKIIRYTGLTKAEIKKIEIEMTASAADES